MLMNSRVTCSIGRPTLWAVVVLALATSGRSASADGIYSITGLGTLSGQSSSVATSINNSGQVVGISYNSSDGNFASGVSVGGPSAPPRFNQTGDGAQSFLYSNGHMTQIDPLGGPAMSINNLGQVVGGPYSSINDLGQYVGGAGVASEANKSVNDQLVSGGTTTTLQYFVPYAINNAGQIAGTSYGPPSLSEGSSHPAIYLNGQVTDLVSKIAVGQYYDSAAVAINQKGDVVFSVTAQSGTVQSYLYNASTGTVINLTGLTGSGMIAAALNGKDQAVGGGLLYSNGGIQSLLSLLPASSGWSSLNATGINDSGQIVGQGTFNGQLEAFEMTPNAVPEPATLAIWALASLCVGSKLIAMRAARA